MFVVNQANRIQMQTRSLDCAAVRVVIIYSFIFFHVCAAHSLPQLAVRRPQLVGFVRARKNNLN